MAGKGFERVSHMAAGWMGKILRQDVGAAGLDRVEGKQRKKCGWGRNEVEKRIAALRPRIRTDKGERLNTDLHRFHR